MSSPLKYIGLKITLVTLKKSVRALKKNTAAVTYTVTDSPTEDLQADICVAF